MGKETQLDLSGTVNFSQEAGGALTGFDIDAYTGAPVERFWGKLVVSLDGISAKERMPVFKNHDRNEIVGHSTGISKDSSFRVRGAFSKSTKAAKEVMALAKEGFPWQASIGVRPKTTVEIREGSSMMVNGQDVSGPAEVWLESEVFETSFVPLGADGNTSVAVFSDKADADQNFAPADEMLQNEWAKMSQKEKAEYADYENFVWYKKPIAGVVMRECSRIEQEDGNAVPSADALKAEWDKDANLRSEFAGDYELYAAYKTPMPGIRVKQTGRGVQR